MMTRRQQNNTQRDYVILKEEQERSERKTPSQFATSATRTHQQNDGDYNMK